MVGSAVFCSRVFSYNNTITHPSLTDNVAKVYNVKFGRKLSNQEINWLKQGSIEEDRNPRWLNHFYNPQINQGLGNFASAKDWAQNPKLQLIYLKPISGGDQTWQKAINSFVDGDKETAFIALGHVLHLLEDMTVPAHTRLDPHPSIKEYEDLLKTSLGVRVENILAQVKIDPHLAGDPYEKWVEQKIGSNINFEPQPINSDNLDFSFDSLANFSSKYFLSKDTIDFNSLVIKNRVYKEENNIDFECVETEIEGEKICLAIHKKSKIGSEEFLLDSGAISVHPDYFSLLAPKAVSYGAGVIDLFFREAEAAKQKEQQKSWWQKLKEKANGVLASLSGSLYAGISANEPTQSEPVASEAPKASPATTEIVQYSLPSNTVEARDKIAAQLPLNTVEAQEKLGGRILEEVNPQDKKIPSVITEEINPSQVPLPSASPIVTASPAPSFLPGGGGSSSNQDSSSDTTAPDTTIPASPAATIATTTATFEFSSSETSSTFSCQLDSATSTSCVSPKEYTNLSEGSHTFKVAATDADGNIDATPAEYTWIVDLSSPQLSNISSSPGRNSALISWTSSETGIFQVEYGSSTSYGLASATTTAANLTLGSLSIDTTYHFRLLAQDSVGNATTTIDYSFATTAQAENVVISEIQIGGAVVTDEFVELYNPTSSDINLLGWRLTKKSATGSTTSNLLTSFSDKIIPAHGYFLITHPTGYDGGVTSDAVYSTGSSLAEDNTLILYSDAGHTIIDLVGFGTASSSETATIDNPPDNQSVERKSGLTSTAVTLFSGQHKWFGNGYDTDNNYQDFVVQANPSPQNSLMLTESRTSWPILMTASAWPTWQKNLARTGQLAVNSLSSSTMAIKWTTTTVATKEFTTRPMLDDEGSIYIGRADGLAKYSSAGEFLWLCATSTTASVPLIVSDGTIFFRGSGGLYAINKGGQLKWKYALSGTAGVNAAIAILSDGTLITQSAENIYAINQDATLKWIYSPSHGMGSSNSIGAFVIDSSDNIYITIDKYIYKINSAGSLIWEKTLGDSYSSLALGSDNILYVSVATWVPSAYQGGFYALSASDGSIIWADQHGFNNHAELAPAIDASGKVYNILYFGDSTRKLQVYNATSTHSWASNLGNSGFAAPLITADNKIYLADQKTIKIFDASDGSLIYGFTMPDNEDINNYFGAVGSDGTLYLPCANGLKLYAIGN